MERISIGAREARDVLRLPGLYNSSPCSASWPLCLPEASLRIEFRVLRASVDAGTLGQKHIDHDSSRSPLIVILFTSKAEMLRELIACRMI